MWKAATSSWAVSYRGRMRVLLALIVATALLAVTGCVPDEPMPTLPPTPTAEPVFESEEEALAAAEEAYAAYVDMSNRIAADGGMNPERIAPLVTEERLSDEIEGFAAYQDAGIRLEGQTTLETGELQSYVDNGDELEVVFYACWDASATRVINQEGQDVTPADRQTRVLLEVVMSGSEGTLPLLLESDEAWSSEPC